YRGVPGGIPVAGGTCQSASIGGSIERDLSHAQPPTDGQAWHHRRHQYAERCQGHSAKVVRDAACPPLRHALPLEPVSGGPQALPVRSEDALSTTGSCRGTCGTPPHSLTTTRIGVGWKLLQGLRVCGQFEITASTFISARRPT